MKRAAAEGLMVRDGRSPRVMQLAWGRIGVEGGRSFKDAKLWPGGGHAWDWMETGTRHRPGVQIKEQSPVRHRRLPFC